MSVMAEVVGTGYQEKVPLSEINRNRGRYLIPGTTVPFSIDNGVVDITGMKVV